MNNILQSEKRNLQYSRYAWCIGIGNYTELNNHNLRYAVSDAKAIAEKLGDPRYGEFSVKCYTNPLQTTKAALEEILDNGLNDKSLNDQDLVVIFISCHGSIYGRNHTFCLLPSNASFNERGTVNKNTVIDIHDIAKAITSSKPKNIIIFLDACYSGGVGEAFQQLNLDKDITPGTNLFMIAAARHDQVAVQTSRDQHGSFTSSLLRAFEQTPKNDREWITISEVYAFIAKEFENEKNKDTTQIQCITTHVNPNILFTKNPHYSLESFAFREGVRKLLQLVQYEPIEIDISEEVPANFYVAELKSGVSIKKIGIVTYYNQIASLPFKHLEKVTSFLKRQVEVGNLHEGLLVTSAEIPNEISQQIKMPFLTIETYENIWRNLIDFKKYLHQLVNDYEISQRDDIPPLSTRYIPLRAEFHSHEIFNQGLKLQNQANVYKSKTIWQGDAQEAVLGWLNDSKSTQLALLADYGTGKTTFCQYVAALLAKQRLEANKNQLYGARIPLLIPLLDFSKVPVDLEGYIVAYLKRYCKVTNPDYYALRKMAEAGLLLFILDGFDEMASRAATDTIYQNIAVFKELSHIPNNKILLTTRPEYFTSLGQESDVLYAFDRLYLQLFDDNQIDLYLQKRVPFITSIGKIPGKNWKYYREKINSIHDLSDLVRRPVLLEMIIKTLPTLIDNEETINRPNLYRRYLEGELDRQLEKQRRDLQINKQARFEIMEQLALTLYRNDKVEMTSRRILEISRELLTIEQQEEMEASLREIVTCSFLIRKNETYRFSHESFLEYLVALHLAKDISHNILETFRQKPINWTTLGFLLEFEKNSLQRSSNNLSLKVAQLPVVFDLFSLVTWFGEYRTTKWIATNAFSLLARMLPSPLLCSLPLSGSDLTKALLAGVLLAGANLTETHLRNADLSGADLSGANLRNADLRNADLSGADLRNADLSGADLSEANLSRARLRHAKLIRSKLIDANLELSDVAHADLSGADLSNTNLSYASLIGANIRGANIRGARMQGTFGITL